MANNNGKEVYDFKRTIKTSGHGVTKQQAKELKNKWNTKIYRKNDSDNGDNYVHVVTPP
jgi:hypothetical protein